MADLANIQEETGAAPLSRLDMTERSKISGFGGLTIAITGFCVILAAVVWLATLQRIAFERTEAVRNATAEISKLAIAYEEHSLRTLRGVDQALSLIKDEYERRGSYVDIPRLISAGRFDPALFTHIGIVDKHGALVRGSYAGARVELSDREYFRAHIESDTGKIFIGEPALGRVTGKWAIQISRRLNRADGSFDGVVYMAVDPSYFANFYRRIDLGPDGLVSLVSARAGSTA